MQIEIIDVKVNKQGKFNLIEVAYKDDKGKVGGKKQADFAIKEGKDVLVNAKQGDVLNVKSEKDAKDYWQWVVISKAGANDSNNNKSYAAPKSNYETPEERARRQTLIVRQSSLTNAISTLKTEKVTPAVGDVLALADEYVKFVYGTAEATPVESMEDDIPF